MLLELHVKTYTNCYLQREHILKRDRRINPTLKKALFSEFSERLSMTAGSPAVIGWPVFQAHYGTIRNFLDREVQKLASSRLRWDVSYKEPNHLGRFNGEKVFKDLVT